MRTRPLVERGLLAGGVLLAALAGSGFAYESVAAASDARSFPAPGRLLNVGGYPMHLLCTGTGSPTVIMDAGLGGWSLDWSKVQVPLSASARVCTYDRPGLGWSEPRPEPRDAQHAVDELHALLATAEIDRPLVLVGHSNGGLRMLLYAAEYRDDVAGLVLVDPTPVSTDEEQLAFLSPGEQTEFATLSNDRASARDQGGLPLLTVIQALQPFGVARLFTDSFLETSVYGRLSSDLQPAYRAGINRAAYMSTLSAEMERRATSVEQVRGAGGLGDLPTVVLGSSKPTAFYADALSPELSGRMLELALKMLAGARQSIARLSSNGRVEAVAQSGHYIQFDRPEAVISTVQKMLARQSGGTP